MGIVGEERSIGSECSARSREVCEQVRGNKRKRESMI